MTCNNTTSGAENSPENPVTEKKVTLTFEEKLKLLEDSGSINMSKLNSPGSSPISGIAIVGGIQKPKEATNEQEG